jgi:hypothetical protein
MMKTVQLIISLTLLSQYGYAHAAGYYGETITHTSPGSSQSSNSPHDELTSYFQDPGLGTYETATFSSRPAPYVSVSARSIPLASNLGVNYPSFVAADMAYSFSVTGPANSVVPIWFQGQFDIFNDNNGGFASVAFTISANSNAGMYQSAGFLAQCDGMVTPPVIAQCFFDREAVPTTPASILTVKFGDKKGFNLQGGSRQDGFFSGVLMAYTDALGQSNGTVGLSAQAKTVAIGTLDDAISIAFIDPVLTIDPDYLAANPSATIDIYQGVGNTMLAVPEVSSIYLCSAGLLLLGVRRGLGSRSTRISIRGALKSPRNKT